MKTPKEEVKETEMDRRRSEDKLKSLVIFFLVCGMAVSGYFLYSLNKENDLMASQIEMKQQDLVRSAEIFDQIESNLVEIRSREGLVNQFLYQNDNLENLPPEERIFQEIAMIEELNERNNQLIEKLNKSVADKDGQIQTYIRTTKNLNVKLKEYRTRTEILMAEADALRNDLDDEKNKSKSMQVALTYKENEVKDKNQQLELQKEKLAEKREELNTAYYRVGSFKELKDEHVVYKEGGIAGIASVVSVRPDVKANQFKKVDISNLNMIPVNSKEAEIISNHEINTYEIVKDGSGNIRWIKINDKEKFWDKTKYLVVVTKYQVEDEVAAVD